MNHRKKIFAGILSVAIPPLLILGVFYSEKFAYLQSMASLSIRKDLWYFAWNVISEHVLLGTGMYNSLLLHTPGERLNMESIPMLTDIFFEGGRFSHAHNTILQLWLGGGFFYFLIYYFIILFSFYRGFQSRQNRIVFASSLVVLAFFLEGFLNYHLMSHSFLLILWIALAVIFKYSGDLKNEQPIKNFRIVGFSFMAITISYAAVLVIHATSLNRVRSIKGWDNFDNLVLRGELGKDRGENLAVAEKLSFGLYRSMLPERKFCQQYAEIKYYRYKLADTPESLHSAHDAYANCLEKGFNNPLIYYRLFETSNNAEDAVKFRKLVEQYDSFHFVNKWIIQY